MEVEFASYGSLATTLTKRALSYDMPNSNLQTYYLILTLTLLLFWTTIISLLIYFISSLEPPKPTPPCRGSLIHEEICYCPASISHCTPTPPESITIRNQDSGPETPVKQIIIYFALAMSICGILVQIVVLSGWWSPWGEKIVWRKGASGWEWKVSSVGKGKKGGNSEQAPLIVSES
ncbi:uncharacterized protein Bfra_004410 [Botrytis fragariae]|uniref:Uncharacterized protein n=1 Tax=Botrytis fragariae TaxID=1964551 RepID=A0A8H6AV76_9HELO|nr:uncharacterized protein Bfra_004410 [Botrytis fragariae]KAF5874403.1 hypothetical protein Bfra_004410 [Botrytis fragariae]